MFIAFVMIVTNILNIILEYTNKSISILLWGVLFLIVTVPHSLLYNTGIVSNTTLDQAGAFVIFFNLTYFISKIILEKRVRLGFKKKLINDSLLFQEDRDYINLIVLMYLVACVIIIYGIFMSGLSILNFTWAEGQIRDISFFDRLASFILISVSGIACVTFLRKEKGKFVIVAIAYTLYIFITRSRYNIMPFILPFIYVFLYSGKVKNVIRAMFLGFIVLFLVFFLQQVRYAGTLADLLNNYSIAEIIGNTVNFMKDGRGEFGLSQVFYFFVENNNNFNNFEEGKTYLRLSLLPFPSSIFEFKPSDFATDMWEAWHGMKTTIGTMHPTLYGDVYANFGFWGFIMGLFYAVFTKINDVIITTANTESKKVLYMGIIGTMYVLLARGAVYNSIANAFWSIILLNIIQYFLLLRKKKY